MGNSQAIGQLAEQRAFDYLTKQGLVCLAKNYHCRMGEIDLIFKDGDEIIFVEVKHRKNNVFGTGLESITASKQAKIIKTAAYFLSQHKMYQSYSCRFDAVCIDSNGNADWVKAAFILP